MANSVKFSLVGQRVWVAGHRGMVGSAIVRRLAAEQCEILTAERRSLDLMDPFATHAWVADNRPDAIFVAAAKVGGIYANDQRPAEFLHQNLMIEANIIDAAHRAGTSKLLFLGSSCIYPRDATQPIDESTLLTGPLEATNEWYAVAKIAGIKLCQAYRKQFGSDFISAMPTNLYGPGDNFDLESSHVIPALIRKSHEAKIGGRQELVVWGSGTPRREFLHVDDCADALAHLMKTYSGEQHVNVGSGTDLTIAELAELVARVVGFKGKVIFDSSKPDGTPRKLMSVEKLRALGWQPKIALESGLTALHQWYLQSLQRVSA
jgi:GDP-L-fucose synthase